jgi:hypothetical protein
MFGRWRKRPAEAPVDSPADALGAGFSFRNAGKRVLSIYLEPMAYRYVLRPGETLRIAPRVEYEALDLFDDDGEEALTLGINGWLEPGEVTIDGGPAVPWPDDGKTSSDPHE